MPSAGSILWFAALARVTYDRAGAHRGRRGVAIAGNGDLTWCFQSVPGQHFPGEPIGLPLDPPGPFLFLSDPFGLLSNFAAGSLVLSRYHPAQPLWAL